MRVKNLFINRILPISAPLALLLFASSGCGIKRDFVSMKERIAALEENQRNLELRVARQDSLGREQQEALRGLQTRAENPAPMSSSNAGKLSERTWAGELPLGLSQPDGPRKDFKEAYNEAYLEITRGDYDKAIAGFRAFLRSYPQSSLADNAQYWIGEGFYARKQYREALAEFRKVVDDYPNQDKVPAAMLKAGMCHIELGDRDEARKMWDRLLKKFPKSQEAATARRRTAGN